MYDSSIISFNISTDPVFMQIQDMLDKAFNQNSDLNGLNTSFRSRMAISTKTLSTKITKQRHSTINVKKRKLFGQFTNRKLLFYNEKRNVLWTRRYI